MYQYIIKLSEYTNISWFPFEFVGALALKESIWYLQVVLHGQDTQLCTVRASFSPAMQLNTRILKGVNSRTNPSIRVSSNEQSLSIWVTAYRLLKHIIEFIF